jgi:hypothetical protein
MIPGTLAGDPRGKAREEKPERKREWKLTDGSWQ